MMENSSGQINPNLGPPSPAPAALSSVAPYRG